MSLWQTQAWQEMLISSGQSEEYFMIERNIDVDSSSDSEELAEENIIFVEKRKVSMWEYGLFVIGLSLPLEKGVPEGGGIISALKELCQEEKCLFIQIETLDYSMQPHFSSEEKIVWGTVWETSGFTLWYFKKFIPSYTAVIDLTKTEEEYFAAMKQKGRYNIRLAEKKWVVVEQVEKNAYNAKIFYELMSLTTTRNNFAGNTQKYYEDFLEKMEDSQLLFAYHEEKVIAAGIFVYHWDTALYYYGASDNEYRKVMAPHLLQAKAIELAKNRGCKIYDFLGTAGPEEVNSSLAGVTKFKMQLTPDRRKVSEWYIFVNKKLKYTLIQILKKFKK